nr:hypothetical protein [Pararhizobium qamdonense]
MNDMTDARLRDSKLGGDQSLVSTRLHTTLDLIALLIGEFGVSVALTNTESAVLTGVLHVLDARSVKQIVESRVGPISVTMANLLVGGCRPKKRFSHEKMNSPALQLSVDG